MTYKIRKATTEDPEPNTWSTFDLLEGGKTYKVVMWTCPRGQHILLVHEKRPSEKNWQIAHDGKVTPSVACGEIAGSHPHCAGCHFHEFLELEGWS